jgi:hypothetical protein
MQVISGKMALIPLWLKDYYIFPGATESLFTYIGLASSCFYPLSANL